MNHLIPGLEAAGSAESRDSCLLTEEEGDRRRKRRSLSDLDSPLNGGSVLLNSDLIVR